MKKIRTDCLVNEFAVTLAHIDPDVVPFKQDAIKHFNETVRCAQSGIFYGEIERVRCL
jgi:hypothetical protein